MWTGLTSQKYALGAEQAASNFSNCNNTFLSALCYNWNQNLAVSNIKTVVVVLKVSVSEGVGGKSLTDDDVMRRLSTCFVLVIQLKNCSCINDQCGVLSEDCVNCWWIRLGVGGTFRPTHHYCIITVLSWICSVYPLLQIHPLADRTFWER